MKQRGLFLLLVFLLLGAVGVLVSLPVVCWEYCSDNLTTWVVISTFSGVLILFKACLLWLVFKSFRKASC